MFNFAAGKQIQQIKKMQKRLLHIAGLILAVLFLTGGNALAQVTTSSIGGKVTAHKRELIGATVTATHQPSGTVYRAVTNEKGRYSIQGMRVGGPYLLLFSYLGHKDEQVTNVILALGEQGVYDVDLEEDQTLLGEIQVTGRATMRGLGAASNFTQQEVENTPTVDRSVFDVAKLSPLVHGLKNAGGGVSIAGMNNRYNSFQIDGVMNNDAFGLTSSGINGGMSNATPVSIDAVEQVQVAVSPFDVRQSGFTGGIINTITKSGTNELKGSAYAFYTDENLYGRWSQLYDEKRKLTEERTQTYGFTLGGPIVKDKLFFFVNGEFKNNTYPSTYYPGAPGYFLSAAAAQQVADRYYQYTGIRESFGPRDIESKYLNLTGRLDWNINDRNKLTVRYQFNKADRDYWSSTATNYTFNDSGYKISNNTNSVVAELTSHIGESYYNEMRASYSRVRDHRDVPYQGPTMYIQNTGSYDENGLLMADKPTSNIVNIGTNYSSAVNFLNQDNLTFEDNFSIYAGDHSITVGTHNEFFFMKNAFIQYANGQFYYGKMPTKDADGNLVSPDGVTGFLNGYAKQFAWRYSDEAVTGTTRWATPFKAGQVGLYVQDKWDISTALQLTYGIRADVPLYLNAPTRNVQFNASEYARNYGVRTGQRPLSRVMLSPRLGFRWYADKDRNTVLRGGVGVFSGRAPFVWLENVWANTGIEMKGTNITENVPQFQDYAMDPAGAAASAAGAASAPTINTVDKDFLMPQVIRANLAWEQKLPFGIKMTIEGLFSKDMNNVWFQNLALVDKGEKVYAVSPDYPNSATTYYSQKLGSYYAIVNLTNTHKGYSYQGMVKLEKSFDFGLDLMASYTFNQTYSVNEGSSSVAYSNWAGYYCIDPAEPKASHSVFEQPHSVLAVATWNSPRYAAGRMQTHISLTYNGNTGQRYSLTMSDATTDSFNGDKRAGNSLLYIPTEQELQVMRFKKEEDRAAYGEWIANDSYAKNHRGQYAERNSNSAVWENHFDLHFAQDFFYLKKKGSKLQLVVDIINVANLLNHNWGTYYSGTVYENILEVSEVNKADDGTRTAVYSFLGNSPKKNDLYSRWHAQVGLRLTF